MKHLAYLFPLLLSNFALAEPWTILANFNGGSSEQSAQNNSDGFSGAAGRSTYSKAAILRGGMSAKMEILQGETGFGMWGGEFIFPHKAYKGESIWFSIHTFMPAGFDHYSYSGGSRLKFMRIQTFSPGGSNLGYNDLYFDMKGEPNPLKWIYEGEQVWVDVGAAQDFPKFDIWESYEMAVTLDSVSKDNGGLAEVKIWKNRQLLKHITNRITLADPNGYSNRALLFTYWNGGAPKTQHMYTDEITITNIEPANKDSFGNSFVGGIELGEIPKPPKN